MTQILAQQRKLLAASDALPDLVALIKQGDATLVTAVNQFADVCATHGLIATT